MLRQPGIGMVAALIALLIVIAAGPVAAKAAAPEAGPPAAAGKNVKGPSVATYVAIFREMGFTIGEVVDYQKEGQSKFPGRYFHFTATKGNEKQDVEVLGCNNGTDCIAAQVGAYCCEVPDDADSYAWELHLSRTYLAKIFRDAYQVNHKFFFWTVGMATAEVRRICEYEVDEHHQIMAEAKKYDYQETMKVHEPPVWPIEMPRGSSGAAPAR
jgi:hypothetical protein